MPYTHFVYAWLGIIPTELRNQKNGPLLGYRMYQRDDFISRL